MTAAPNEAPLPPPGKTTLDAMYLAADSAMRDAEAGLVRWRGEAGTDAGKGWVAHYTERRNAFAGVLRLIEKIRVDQSVYEALFPQAKARAQR
ncbi:hypothetical protein RPPS3_25540 [Rhodopseudomonas palustris]|uniref:hypothetical protein n=1 Tax=Rhodopseudomonas palustris TaxID=1076 RepID=UPI000D1B6EA1|nr:hypothetical protein [Rhodopseudomonas palustris]AVT76617.1 hypothetical protein RPPS3_25540 [Rhodopseudomonas palustris]